MGLLIKAALGALVVLLIGVLAKTKNYYIAGLIPLFPTFALIAHYIVASERGYRGAACHHCIRDVVNHPVFHLSAVAVVLHRFSASAPGAGRGGGLLEPQRLGAHLLLEPLSLAQRAATVHGKRPSRDVTAGQQIIDQVDHLFLAGRNFHQRLVKRLLTILGIIALVK